MGQERLARRLVKAVDTNVLARALMRDDPVQTPVADELLQAGAFVSLTVLLETGWLLRSRYRLSRGETAAALAAVLDMPDVVVEASGAARWAVERMARGGDWADLVHIAASRGAESFASFDGGVAKAAGADSPVPVETLA